MSDYSFMRSGVGSAYVEANSSRAEELQQMQQVMAVMKVLMEDCLITAGRFASLCGRKQITGEDTIRALKYEAHEFFKRDGLESRYFESLAEEEKHTYESSDEEEEEDDEPPEEQPEPYSERFVKGSQADAIFHGQMLAYHREWDGWEPDDPLIAAIKAAIDKSQLALQANTF